MSKLLLIRHGESEWNKLGLWTGWMDIDLSEKGVNEARETAKLIPEDTKIDVVFTSKLKRAVHTWEEIANILNLKNTPVFSTEKLNERDYGDFTGKNKWEIKEKVGQEEFLKIRRSYDYPIQNGESLKQVFERVIPFYKNTIFPYLADNKNVLISAHGNSLRSLIKYLENISDENISRLELATGEMYIYNISKEGKILDKKIIGAK